jgi:hypothetical protein
VKLFLWKADLLIKLPGGLLSKKYRDRFPIKIDELNLKTQKFKLKDDLLLKNKLKSPANLAKMKNKFEKQKIFLCKAENDNKSGKDEKSLTERGERPTKIIRKPKKSIVLNAGSINQHQKILQNFSTTIYSPKGDFKTWANDQKKITPKPKTNKAPKLAEGWNQAPNAQNLNNTGEINFSNKEKNLAHTEKTAKRKSVNSNQLFLNTTNKKNNSPLDNGHLSSGNRANPNTSEFENTNLPPKTKPNIVDKNKRDKSPHLTNRGICPNTNERNSENGSSKRYHEISGTNRRKKLGIGFLNKVDPKKIKSMIKKQLKLTEISKEDDCVRKTVSSGNNLNLNLNMNMTAKISKITPKCQNSISLLVDKRVPAEDRRSKTPNPIRGHLANREASFNLIINREKDFKKKKANTRKRLKSPGYSVSNNCNKTHLVGVGGPQSTKNNNMRPRRTEDNYANSDNEVSEKRHRRATSTKFMNSFQSG